MIAQSPGYHDSLLVVLAEKRPQRGKGYEKRLPAYLEVCVTVLDSTWHERVGGSLSRLSQNSS
jgi:hypothetical protein